MEGTKNCFVIVSTTLSPKVSYQYFENSLFNAFASYFAMRDPIGLACLYINL